MLFLMKIVKFSASIMTGLWARTGGRGRGNTGCFHPRGDPSWRASPNGHVAMASDLGSEGEEGEVSQGPGYPEALLHPRWTLRDPCKLRSAALPTGAEGNWGGLSLPVRLRPSHFHCVHLGGAPALGLTGPQLGAEIHTAAGEEPCEGEDAVLGARLSPASPVLIRDLPPKHTHGPQMAGKDRQGKGGPSVAH